MKVVAFVKFPISFILCIVVFNGMLNVLTYLDVALFQLHSSHPMMKMMMTIHQIVKSMRLKSTKVCILRTSSAAFFLFFVLNIIMSCLYFRLILSDTQHSNINISSNIPICSDNARENSKTESLKFKSIYGIRHFLTLRSKYPMVTIEKISIHFVRDCSYHSRLFLICRLLFVFDSIPFFMFLCLYVLSFSCYIQLKTLNGIT